MIGWISVHRKMFANAIMKKPNYLSVWIYLLLMANHETVEIIWNNEKILIQRGQFIGSIKKIADYYSISKATVSYILEYFENDHMIIKKSNKKFTLFEIINYDKYQKVGRVVERVGSSETLVNTGLNEGAKNNLNGNMFSKLPQIETNNNVNNVNKNDSVQNKLEQPTIFQISKKLSKDEVLENEFEKFWNYYNKKTNKKKCQAKWERISAADKNIIRVHLPKYIKATPDKKYRKDPCTYLNNGSWNDEIISFSNAEDNSSRQTSLVNKIGVQ